MSKKSQNRYIVNNNTLVVGVDIGKSSSVARYLLPDGRPSKQFIFTTSRSGFDAFAAWLEESRVRCGMESVMVGMEPTGHYYELLARYLKDKGVRAVLVNPYHTKCSKEIYDNSPGKTDAKDALVIAGLVRQGNCFNIRLPEGVYADLKALGRAREKKAVELTAKVNYLIRLMDTLFPEFFGIFKKHAGMTALYLLANCPTPASMLALGEAKLTEIIRAQSHGKLGTARAAALIKAAENTIGTGGSALVVEVRETVEDIIVLQRRLKDTEAAQREALKQVPYATDLLSLKGVGVVTIAGIIGEAGDIRGFHSAKGLVKLAGLSLYEESSGTHKGVLKITKRGRPLLRKLLYLLSLRLVKSGHDLHEYYQGLRGGEKPVPAPKALVAVSRKAAKIIFGVVKYGRQVVKDQVPCPCTSEAGLAEAA